MANQLYPTFEIPAIWQEDTENTQVLRAGPLFDFELGDFVRDGSNRIIMVNGRDEYMIWCIKILQTQIWACDSYLDTGIDMDGALAQPGVKAVQSALERTITEALMANPITQRVYGFQFAGQADEVSVSFIIKPHMWDAFDINMNIVL